MDKQLYWIDASYYGLRWFLLPKASDKQYVVAIGGADANAEALQTLGFRRHQRFGYWYRQGMPAGGAIKRALPEVKWYPIASASEVVLAVGEPGAAATARREDRVAAPAEQKTEDGKAVATLLGNLNILHEVMAAKFEVDIHQRDHGILTITGSRDAEGRPIIALRLALRERTREAAFRVDGAGQVHLDRTTEKASLGEPRIGLDRDVVAGLMDSVRELGFLRGRREAPAVFRAAVTWQAPDTTVVRGEVTITRVRAGAGVGVAALLDAELTDETGAARRASAVPVSQWDDSDEVRRAAVQAMTGAFGADYQLADNTGVSATNAGGNDDSADTAGSSDDAVRPVHGEHDGEQRAAEDVAGADPADPSGDGSGARAGKRQRAPVERDDNGLLFGGLKGGSNYRLTAPDLLMDGWNPDAAVERNLQALRILARAKESGVAPDAEERDKLIGYVGWGGLPGVFTPRHILHTSFDDELRECLSEEEYAAARASTMNAHYTAAPVIDAIWKSVRRAGFSGGRVLEPGAGTGLFLACVPKAVAKATRFVAVEKDPTTGAILETLYPAARVMTTGYEEAPIPNDSMSLVIGNVPFGDYRVYDPAYRTLKAPIHDYFIIKSLDKLQPGGVMACITSTGTLDKQRTKYREAMYQRADLVAACRLPNDTFQRNANTQVTTDVLFFRKRKPGEDAQPFDWESGEGATLTCASSGEPIAVNGVFGTRRGQILGFPMLSTSMYGSPETTVARSHPKTREVMDRESVFSKLARACPKDIWDPESTTGVELFEEVAPPDGERGAFDADQEGNFVVRDGVVGQVLDSRFCPSTFRNRLDEGRVRSWLVVRDAAKEVLRVQAAGGDDAAVQAAQAGLGRTYDEAVAQHGPISLRVNRRALADDPDLDILLACEDFDQDHGTAAKTEIFTERTLIPHAAEPPVDTAENALLWCVDHFARVIPERIAEALGRPWEECRAELRGQVFRDPSSGAFETAAKYLSGNVRAKLREAEQAVKAAPGEYADNVAALTERLPAWVTGPEIDANLGSPWVPSEDIRKFVEILYDAEEGGADLYKVGHNEVTAEWVVKVPAWATAPRWSTHYFEASELVELALRGQMPKAYDRVDGASVLNATETAIAIEKQKEIREEFRNWIWSDADRTMNLETIYNETFNSFRSPDYSAMRVTVPGMTATRSLRPHQTRGVARITMERNTLLAHPVGFGKTATFCASAMKLKSLGLASKSMVVVRKNTLYDCAAEAKRWFPQARVLMIRSEDLNPKGRKQFWRRVQATNPDLVLVTPEAFKRIRLPRDAEIRFLQNEVAYQEMAMGCAIKVADGEGRTATRATKRIEKVRAGILSRLQALMNAGEKDDGRVTLADLGIDALFVDEAQNYKNLQVMTREQMLGVPGAASQRAADLFAKVQYFQESGKRVVFATGTPVVNTLAEIFNVQRYLSPELLEEANVHHFDAWVAQFGEPVASLEPDPGGAGYRTVRRLAEIRNVPELVAMFAQVTDAVQEGSVDLGRPTAHFHMYPSEATPLQAIYREVLAERVQAIRQRGGRGSNKGEDNVLAVLGDSRRAALDLRTMVPGLARLSFEDGAEHAGGKIASVAREVKKRYDASTEKKGTQLLFLDLGTPGGKSEWNAYAEIRLGLEGAGVPAEEIAYIHDGKTDQAKAELFKRVRAGDVRILIGSTEKMGEGTNVQDRIVALHHINAPFHPGAVIQRNGRGIRQGNQNSDVDICTHVTQGLLEDWNWHLVLLKERFIRQIMEGVAVGDDGAGLDRRMVEDASASMSYEEIEAMASGDPLVKEKCSFDAEVKRLRMLRDAHERYQGQLRRDKASAEDSRRHVEGVLGQVDTMAQALEPDDAKAPGLCVNGKTWTGEGAFAKAGEALHEAVSAARVTPWRHDIVGTVRGMQIAAHRGSGGILLQLVSPATGTPSMFQIEMSQNPAGTAKRLQNLARELAASPQKLRERIAGLDDRIAKLDREIGGSWPHEAKFTALLSEQSRVNIALEKQNAAVAEDKNAVRAADRFEMKLIGLGATADLRACLSDEAEIPWGDADTDDEMESSARAESGQQTPVALAASAGPRT